MKTQALLAAASLLIAAGSSFAAETNEAFYDQVFRSNTGTSSVTREQVKAEVLAARKAGLLDTNEAELSLAYMAPRPKSPEVKAQLAAKSDLAPIPQR